MKPQKNNKKNKWVIKPLVSDQVYTDRQEQLDYFYKTALKASTRRTMSTVLLGQRRMGKTEIFKRVVNRLFAEQDPKDPNSVVPVFFTFPDSDIDYKKFAVDYFENFLKYFTAFYTGNHKLVQNAVKGDSLLSHVKDSVSLFPDKEILEWILPAYDSIEKGESVIPHKDALELPRRISDYTDITIVMFLDEFQNTRLPQYNFDIVGLMQESVESPTCPHFVTGSAMSILAREIIGRGALFGRFDSEVIEPMTWYWGAELAKKAAAFYGAELPELMAPPVSLRCGGNPFYITALIRQAAKQEKPITNEDELNKLLAVDISSGFIWGELNDQVSRWIERINDKNITKWILYLSALEENEEKDHRNRLNIKKIQQTIKEKDGKTVSIDTIQDVLVKLSRGDLVEYLELGGWFRRIKDPILLEFLKVWGRIEVEGKRQSRIRDDLIFKYQKQKRKISEYKGYLAEIHMSQVLLSSQDKIIPARFFNTDKDVQMPWRFTYVHHRVRLESGKGKEIDVLGAAGIEQWICQSKWVTGKKIGIDVLKEIQNQAELLLMEKDAEIIRLWLFSHEGLTDEAEKYAEKYGIFWSAREEFDELLGFVGLRRLPEI